MAGEVIANLTHDGARNAVITFFGVGEWSGFWTMAVDLSILHPRPIDIKVDAVYYAISEGVEVQFAWESKDKVSHFPFLPLSGRGKIDFSEVSGLNNILPDRTGNLLIRALGTKAQSLFTLVLDLSKHSGDR